MRQRKASTVRTWRENLGLSLMEAAQLMNWDMSNDNARTRFREIDNGRREPSGPMLEVMLLNSRMVDATIMLRTGRTLEAKQILQLSLSAPLMRHVRAQAPGVEAVGPSKTGD